MTHRILSFVLAVLIVFTSVSITVFATNDKSENSTTPSSENETTVDINNKVDPVRNIVVTPTRNLVEFSDGYISTDSQNNSEEFFYYDLSRTFPSLRINYKDGTYSTYSYEEVKRLFDTKFEISIPQNSKNTLTVGKHTARAYFGDYECDFIFNIVNNEKAVINLSVSAENPLIYNSFGSLIKAEDISPEYYHYSEDAITYSVDISYSDGTVESFKNVKNKSFLNGSLFYVSFIQNAFYPFGLGKNEAKAFYQNASSQFDVSLKENGYIDLTLRGTNELILDLTKENGEIDSFTAIDFKVLQFTENSLIGILYTDSLFFKANIKYNYSNSFSDIEITLFDRETTIKSNTLKNNNWFNVFFNAQNIAYAASAYSDGLSDTFASRSFTSFSNNIAGNVIDDVLSLASLSVSYKNFDYKSDDKGIFAYLSVDDAKNMASTHFDVSDVDFTTSKNYKSEDKTIKVYFITKTEGFLSDSSLSYKNGNFVFSTNYKSNYTGNEAPLQIVLNSSGDVTNIAFQKGICEDIKTISATNTKSGVKVTWDESSYAFSYDIYRSENGEEFVKIASTYTNSFTDTSVASGTLYTYKVKAYNPESESAFSNLYTITFLSTPKVSVSSSGNVFTVKWSKVTGATGYTIYRAELVDNKWSSLKSIKKVKASAETYSDKNIETGKIYKYAVRATSSDAKSSYQNSGKVGILETPIPTISSSAKGVKIVFNPVAGSEKYAIYRSDYNTSDKCWSGYKKIAVLKNGETSYIDTTAISGKKCKYKIRAYNGSCKSKTKESNSILYIKAPTVTISNGNSAIDVKWTESSGAESYVVYRSEYDSKKKKWSKWTSVSSELKALKFSDKNVKNAKKYKYAVLAKKGDTTSAYNSSSSMYRLTRTTISTAMAASGVTVKWEKVSGATGYKIYRSEYNPEKNKWSSYKALTKVDKSKTSYTDSTAKNAVKYKYTVKVVKGSSVSARAGSSVIVFVSCPLVEISSTTNGITICWNKISGATGYRLYRSQYDSKNKKWSSYKRIKTLDEKTFKWTDTSLESSKKYRYTVKAVNGDYVSRYKSSNSLTYLSAPNVNASVNDNEEIIVNWDKISGAKSYEILRKENKDNTWSSWEVIATADSSKTSWQDEAAKPNTEYCYAVRAVNGKSKSVYSSSVAVKI